MSHVVVLAGGSPHAHDFAATGAELAHLAVAAGHTVTCCGDPDDAARLVGGADALVFDGLWWRMLGDAYDPWRPQFGYSPGAATRAALAGFVRDGGGLLAVHTAPICFDDWPEWGAVVGGAWQWGHSAHPPPQPATIQVTREHPVVAGLPAEFVVSDEIYGDLAIDPGVDVLAVSRRDADDADQPVVWAHRYGSGRVVYDALGHDRDSLSHADHRQLLSQALAWVTEDAR